MIAHRFIPLAYAALAGGGFVIGLVIAALGETPIGVMPLLGLAALCLFFGLLCAAVAYPPRKD